MAPRQPTHVHAIKRGKVIPWPVDAPSPEDIASRVTYTGNNIHKAYKSPAGDAALKADEAKCETYRRCDWPKLAEALRIAIRARCTGQFRGEYPSRAWIRVNGVLHEARLTSQGQGDYHAFPLNDPAQYPLSHDASTKDILENVPNVIVP